MPFLNCNTHRVYYYSNEKTPRNKDEYLVFLHGAGGNHTLWIKQLRHFQKKYQVVAIDLPGHGRSEGEGEIREIGYYTSFINDIREALGIKKFFLIGHSMGGAVAMETALEYPSLLKGIVLTGVGANFRRVKRVVTHMKRDFDRGVEIACRHFLFTENTTDSYVEFVLLQVKKSRKTVLLNDLTACSHFNLGNRGRDITIPALIIGGGNDRFITSEDSHLLSRKIPNSGLKIIPGTGHMTMLENHQLFNQELDAFISGISGQ